MVDLQTPDQNEDRTGAHLRKHYYLDQYVVVAPARAKRPQQTKESVVSQKTEAHPKIEDSPSIYEVASKHGGWQVKVVENKYPAYTPENEHAEGAQEVVLETPEVGIPFHMLSVDEIQLVLETYQARAKMLRQQFGYISIFKNHGHRAGASLAHTHSQIIASSFIPPQVRHDRSVLTEYQHKHDTSALCDIIRWELKQDERAVAHTRYTTTICPYASQYPLEVWIIPNRQAHSIVDLSPEELHSVADHLKGVSYALASNGIDFNYHLQEGISGEYNHFYIKVTPRIATLAGYELNTGVHINPFSPERAREWYQHHIKTPDVS